MTAEKSSEAEDQRRVLVLRSELVVAPLELREPKSREATLMPVAAFDPLAEDTLFLVFASPALPGGPWPLGMVVSLRVSVVGV